MVSDANFEKVFDVLDSLDVESAAVFLSSMLGYLAPTISDKDWMEAYNTVLIGFDIEDPDTKYPDSQEGMDGEGL